MGTPRLDAARAELIRKTPTCREMSNARAEILNSGLAATPETMIYVRDLLPPDSQWAAFGIGPHAYPMLAQALLLGGHVRVGLEDNYYLEKGVKAPHNAALVEKAVRIMNSLGNTPATPAEARAILGITRSNI